MTPCDPVWPTLIPCDRRWLHVTSCHRHRCSVSTTPRVCPPLTLPCRRRQLKEELRASYYPLDHPSRHQLWANVCQLHGANLGQNDEYESTVRQLEGELGTSRVRGEGKVA